MRKQGIVVLAILFLGMMATPALACNCGKKADAGSVVSSCQAKAGGCGQSSTIMSSCSEELLQANNTACPVSGAPIGSMGEGVTYTHEGKVYQLCCAGCIEKFRADPEKYIKTLEDKG